MAYKRLMLDSGTPMAVRGFIERTIEDHYFSDVHAMLRLPLPGVGITACQNFSITHVLMAVISGISTTLYATKGKSGELFKGVVEEFFPWGAEPGNGAPPKKAAGIIYDVFRNPLTHAGGLSMDWRGNKRVLARKEYAVKIKRCLTENKTTGHPEKWIEALELAENRPNMGPTLRVEKEKKVLLVEGLYWCVRRMIHKMTADSERMKHAASLLSDYK